MNRNRDLLAATGTLYPATPGRARHALFTTFLTPDAELDDSAVWHRVKEQDPARFRRRFKRDLLAEVAASGLSSVLLSEETLFKSSEGTLRRLRRFARRNARSLRIVVYLRRQDDHLVSRYQQGVKIGEIRRLSDPTLHLDYSDVYDYRGRLARIEEILEPDELVVRRYERDAFHRGSLYADFLRTVGVDLPEDGWELPEDRNVSLGAETVEFLRLLNLRRVHHAGARVGMIDNREIVRTLAVEPQGPTLTLPDPVLDDFMAQWADGNAEVARRWLGAGDGVLFRTPRRTAGTTPRQFLDPDRVDHFAGLLGLSEAERVPLRLLARDAAAGR
ncbi:hypothetical protein K8W59_00545 [Nocardioides rotundus]|uniref:hypothetical protein n=1 Tax=Nocardioides rotundus TaxID=1774216 RepID=UPI001CBCCC73|nr:hypothetical protein [Nocardioides rotundus]UAL30085.1 hypothetical protein K8W59_00545 [Nocardioides rotundus]